jgi:hypothetical protein
MQTRTDHCALSVCVKPGGGRRARSGLDSHLMRRTFERETLSGTLCQNFEFPVLLILLYVRVASLYIVRVGPNQF